MIHQSSHTAMVPLLSCTVYQALLTQCHQLASLHVVCSFQGSCCTECPARPTVTLVLHRGNRAIFPPVHVCREGLQGHIRVECLSRRRKIFHGKSIEVRSDLIMSHVCKFIFSNREVMETSLMFFIVRGDEINFVSTHPACRPPHPLQNTPCHISP